MHKLFLRLALATVAFLPAASALAADIDVMPPPPPTEELRPATYDWTGAYVGGWMGGTCIDSTLFDNSVGGGTYLLAGCGFKGGVMGGYNFQMNDHFVAGVEADWGMSNNIVENIDPTADFAFKMNHIATLRGRAGYAIDDTLLFVTAGGAWAQGDLDGIVAADPNHIKVGHWGWSIGAGIEHALTDQIRIRGDYLYTRFQGKKYYSTSCAVTCDIDVHDFGDHEFRVGVAWAF